MKAYTEDSHISGQLRADSKSNSVHKHSLKGFQTYNAKHRGRVLLLGCQHANQCACSIAYGKPMQGTRQIAGKTVQTKNKTPQTKSCLTLTKITMGLVQNCYAEYLPLHGLHNCFLLEGKR